MPDETPNPVRVPHVEAEGRAALRESEARFREMFEHMSSGVAIYEAVADGQDFVFKDFNQAAERTDSIPREAVIGRSVCEVFPGVKDFGLFEVFQRVWRTGKPEHHAARFYTDDRISGWRGNFVYRLASGEVVAIYDDLTELKRAEAQIESLARFPAENPNPVLRIAHEGAVVHANHAAQEVLRDLGGQGGQPAPAAWRETVARVLSSGSVETVEFEHGQHVFSFMVVPIWEMGYTNWYGRDITQRKRAEGALRESEERCRAVFECAQDWIFTKDRDLRFTRINPSMARALGMSPEAAVGLSSADLFGEEIGLLVAETDPCVLEGETVEFERTLLVQGKRTTSHVVKVPLRDSAGQVVGLCAIARDVTEQRSLEREVLAIGARERQRIGQDLHDGLGQHLTGVSLLAKSLERRLSQIELPEAKEAKTIVSLLGEAIAQIRALARGLCPVKSGAEGLLNALRDLAGKVEATSGVPCSVECEAPVPTPDETAAAQLYRIAQEAVHNAIEHGKAKRVAIQLAAQADRLLLTVKDDGLGIPAAELTRPTGLGLSIMRYRASAIGATLDIRRDPAGGTIVACSLRAPAEA